MALDFEKYKKEEFCLNKECVDYGKKDADNIRIKSRKNNQVYCKSCKSSWMITKGTMFYNLKKPVSLVLKVLIMLSEGMGVNAIYRIKGVKSETISNWVIKASKHVEEFSSYLKQNMRLTQCQIDEFWSFIYKKKAKIEPDEIEMEDRGDRWSFVNVLPDSGFIHTVHNGPRNLPVLYSGKGRPCNPVRKVDEDLKYAQVIKNKEKGKLSGFETRVILGEEKAILDIIQAKGRGNTINTSYVESRNGNYRKDNKRLTRKTQCHSKKIDVHDAQINWITAIYNFVGECVAFCKCINLEAKKFETKYKKSSPAMIEGLVDRLLTIEEILMTKVLAT